MATKKPDASAPVKARVLVACSYGKPNDVVLIDASEAENARGLIDTNPDAVAYAESLQG